MNEHLLRHYYYNLPIQVLKTPFTNNSYPKINKSKISSLSTRLEQLNQVVGNRSSLIFSAYLPYNTSQYLFYNLTSTNDKTEEHDKYITAYQNSEPLLILTNQDSTMRTNLNDTIVNYSLSIMLTSHFDVIDVSKPSVEYLQIQFKYLQITIQPILELYKKVIKYLKTGGTLVLPIYHLEYDLINKLTKQFEHFTLTSSYNTKIDNYYTLYLHNYNPQQTKKSQQITMQILNNYLAGIMEQKIKFLEAVLDKNYNEYDKQTLKYNTELFKEIHLQQNIYRNKPLIDDKNIDKIVHTFYKNSESNSSKFIKPIHDNAILVKTTTTLLSLGTGYGTVEYLLLNSGKIKNLICIDQHNDIEFRKFPNKYLKCEFLTRGDEFELQRLLTSKKEHFPKPTKIYINKNWQGSKEAYALLQSFNIPIIIGQ